MGLDVPRITTSARSNLDTPLAEDSTGSRFERLVFLPYIVFLVVVGIGSGLVVLAVLFSLK
jgi:hypothetical protein